ncbi:hypothetical protein D358_00024 [Enterococcus faecalis RP2S-4]|uniref:Uncharacterized protein n=1 Tax=Enterococcus faecalis RP2S-4 TaxID=1244145 RepID=A0ABC9TNT6_ENTFL|nr:hypothetical protein D358_00024 [Enterococcus faecalis RP2S-4]
MFRQINFWLAITNFILALLFIFRGGSFNTVISFAWLVNFVINLNLASKGVHGNK